jgi:hypothetical protein
MPKIQNDYLLKDLMELSVANFYCYDTKNGLEYYSGTLESHSLEKKTTEEKIKAGRYNDTISTITKDTEISLKVVDVCARQDLQALKLGGKITDVTLADNVYAYHMPKNYDVATGKTITLDAVPKEGEEIAVYNNTTKEKLVITTDYTVVDGVITIVDEEILVGDTVFVTGFYYKAPESAKYFEIKEGSVPAMLVVIEVPLFDTDTNIVAIKQYIFPRAKMNASVTMAGQTEKTKNSDETMIDILKDSTVDYLGRVIYLDVE